MPLPPRRVAAFIVLCASLVAAPALAWYLEHTAAMPIALRDRPVGLLALVLAGSTVAVLLARRSRSRRGLVLTAAACVVACAIAAFASARVHARYRLPPSSAAARVGERLPPLELKDDRGAVVALGDLGATPTVMVLFRGTWCPYCRKQLAELAPGARAYAGRVRVLGVTADPPEQLAELRRELDLPFSLVSDRDSQLLRRCELSHCVAILDAEGVVRWEVLSGNWDRLEPPALLHGAYVRR